MCSNTEQQKLGQLYYTAGDYLKEEVRQLSASLGLLYKDATREDFALAAWDLMSKGDPQWATAMTALTDAINKRRNKRLADNCSIGRIQKYIEVRRDYEAAHSI